MKRWVTMVLVAVVGSYLAVRGSTEGVRMWGVGILAFYGGLSCGTLLLKALIEAAVHRNEETKRLWAVIERELSR